MNTMLTILITFLSVIGFCVIIVFLMESVSKASSASKEYKKKRLDYLEKINDKLDDIIRILSK